MKKLIFGVFAGSLSILLPANVFAQGCSNYKYGGTGVKAFPTEEGPKIVSTGKAAVLIDDVEEVQDAYAEATLNAKTEIVKWYNSSEITDECTRSNNKLSDRILSKNPDGTSGSYNKTTAKQLICGTTEKTSGLVKGAVTVEQCYQKGKYVQITLGISPKTLKQAAGLGDNIKFGVDDPKSPNTVRSSSSDGLVPTDGFYYVDEDF